MKKETVSFRMDITFWLAVLLLIATMLSRLGRMLPVDLNLPTGGGEMSEFSEFTLPE
jgi:hypothetical protein